MTNHHSEISGQCTSLDTGTRGTSGPPSTHPLVVRPHLSGFLPVLPGGPSGAAPARPLPTTAPPPLRGVWPVEVGEDEMAEIFSSAKEEAARCSSEAPQMEEAHSTSRSLVRDAT